LSIPHGGRLVNRILREDQRERILKEASTLPKLTVNDELISDIQNIAEGVFSPLEGFLEEEDFLSVLREKRLANGLPWTIPIVLDVSRDEIRDLKEGNEALITDFGGRAIALLHVADMFVFDKEEMAKQVFGTVDWKHPGVAKAFSMKGLLVGGKIDLIIAPERPYGEHYLEPRESRKLFEARGWKTVVAFQTRNVPHIGHEYIQRTALNFVDGLFIQPIIGKKKKGDFKDEVIIAAYQTLFDNNLMPKNAVLGTLHTSMRYAGPREAVFHAIIRKNFGCTHFIVGRDHAGVKDYYSPYSAQEIFKDFPDLDITPLCFSSVFYCRQCQGIANERMCPHKVEYRIEFSGTNVRDCIVNGHPAIPGLRPEVCNVIRKWENPFVEN
jgi:sulfate adenylyltransferase